MSFAQLLILTICLVAGEALKCPTCLGPDCKKPEVPLLECNRHIPELPFGSLKSDSLNADFVCLSLEYKTGTKSTHVRKCHLVGPTEDLCGDIESSLPPLVKLKNCDFELSDNLELESDVEIAEDPADSTIPSTNTPSDSTTESTTESSTTPPTSPVPQTTTDSSATFFVSLSVLTIAVVIHGVV